MRLNSSFFIRCLLMALFAVVPALIGVKAQLSIGAKAGLNAAKINFSNDLYSTSTRKDLYAGLLFNYMVTSKIGIQTEMLYSREGTKEKFQNGQSGEIRKAYLQIPVLLQYNIVGRLFAEAGPQIGFLLSSKEEFSGERDDIKQFYRSADLRLPVGIVYRFGNILQGLGIGARYSFSLRHINKEAVAGGELRNVVFSAGIEYILPLAGDRN